MTRTTLPLDAATVAVHRAQEKFFGDFDPDKWSQITAALNGGADYLSLSAGTTNALTLTGDQTAAGNKTGFWRDKGAQVVNVRAYGAKGDGSDDTTAFNNAFAVAGTTAAFTPQGTGGVTVLLPPGRYVTDGIVVPSNVNVIGAGFGATSWAAKSGISTSYLARLSSYSTIADIYLDGNGQNVALVDIYQAARVMVDRLYLTNTLGDGILFEGASGHTAHANKVTNCYIISCGGVGIHSNDGYTYDQEILQVWIGTCGTGISLNAGANMITNAHVWGSTGDGVYANPASTSVLVNCYLESNGGYGLNVNGGRGIHLVGSRVWNNTSGGVNVSSSADFKLTGSSVFENHGAGVTIANSLYPVMTGNSFYDNQAPQTQTYGVVATGTTDYMTIVGNEIATSRHLTGSMQLVGTHNQVVGNIIDSANTSTSLTYPTAGADQGARIDGAAGQNRSLSFTSSGSARWSVRVTNTAESGGNAGSNLTILSRDDSGNALGTPISITRSSGLITVGDGSHLALGTTTGTQIGTGTTQKVGFYGATPVVQASSTTDLKTVLTNLGLVASGGASPLDLGGGTLKVGAETVTAAAGTNRDITFSSGTSSRWIIRTTSTAEGGSNAGSDLAFVSRDDTGAALGTPLSITRSTGAIALGDGSNLSLGSTTGTKIGTSSTQKLSFWGNTAVVRPTGTPAAATDAATTQALVNDIRSKLISIGLIA